MKFGVAFIVAVLSLAPSVVAQDAPDEADVPATYEADIQAPSADDPSADVKVEASIDASSLTEGTPVEPAAEAVDAALADEDMPALAPADDNEGRQDASASGHAGSDGGRNPEMRVVAIVEGIAGAEADPVAAVPDIEGPDLALEGLWSVPGPRSIDDEAAAESGAPRGVASMVADSTHALDVPPLPSLALAATALLAATTVVATASGTSGGLGLASLKKFAARAAAGLAGLFTRLHSDKILDHPRRNEIFEFVRHNPGERLEIVRRALGLANGPMLHHVRVLDRANVVRVVRSGSMARLYPAGPRVQAQPYLVPVRRRVLQELRTTPGITQREIATRVGLSERAVSYHVGWLTTNGLLSVQREGGAKRCFAAAPA